MMLGAYNAQGTRLPIRYSQNPRKGLYPILLVARMPSDPLSYIRDPPNSRQRKFGEIQIARRYVGLVIDHFDLGTAEYD